MGYEIINNKDKSVMIKFFRETNETIDDLTIRKAFDEARAERSVDRYRWFGDINKENEAILSILFE